MEGSGQAVLSICVIGAGNVGNVVIQQVLKHQQLQLCAVVVKSVGKHATKRQLWPRTVNLIDCLDKAYDFICTRNIQWVIDASSGADVSTLLIKLLTVASPSLKISTANKAGLLRMFRQGVSPMESRLEYEACVAAGVPCIRSLRARIQQKAKVLKITGCLNGTTMFVVNQLMKGHNLEQSLKQAVDSGYAEPGDNSADLQGKDACMKLEILLRLCQLFGGSGEIEVSADTDWSHLVHLAESLHRPQEPLIQLVEWTSEKGAKLTFGHSSCFQHSDLFGANSALLIEMDDGEYKFAGPGAGPL